MAKDSITKNKSGNKGFEMEEYLRAYFIQRGYYVIRGVSIKQLTSDVTDIDLWLYAKSSTLTRERINVDIKNKKKAEAMSRIFWAKGVQTIYNFEKCIVATTDSRKEVGQFAKKHHVMVMDGNFIQKISKSQAVLDLLNTRFTEEELFKLFDLDGMGKMVGDWSSRINSCKGRLIDSPNFLGITETIQDTVYFINQAIVNIQYSATAIRGIYYCLSTLLIQFDGVLKELTFYEDQDRLSHIKEGFKYGDAGATNLSQFLKAIKEPIESEYNIPIGGVNRLLEASLETEANQILSEYFSQQKVIGNLFDMAKIYLDLAYAKEFTNPSKLSPSVVGPIMVILDTNNIKRTMFFDALQSQ